MVIGTELTLEGSPGVPDSMMPPTRRDVHPSFYGEMTRGRLLVVTFTQEGEEGWVPRLVLRKTFPRPIDAASTVRCMG